MSTHTPAGALVAGRPRSVRRTAVASCQRDHEGAHFDREAILEGWQPYPWFDILAKGAGSGHGDGVINCWVERSGFGTYVVQKVNQISRTFRVAQ